ncbi:MAG TPA: hypothetical protein VFF02_16710, partial [Anaeromyxobacteraceae bacterium]|nr:hypothetical protein [Anaeromyxobacteraceae bacterium]
MRVATVAGMGLASVLVAGCASDSALKQQVDSLSDRMTKVETRQGDLESKVDAQGASAKADAQRAEAAAARAE